MSGGRRARPNIRTPEQRRGEGKSCVDCRKYSRKTLYCTKERRVTAENKAACVFFVPRHEGKGGKVRRD
jgi:hypothetical protein